ncbi:hypothetical protein RRG08_065145 [Elysia crispata]|uniref:Uncharacterized protein n=1 Tax=Elysia crispata TaxID=231223 RepID=A0AAE0Z440_9GAST|nr:hypothetical protein RRG08_065145 [Elysia crispata]
MFFHQSTLTHEPVRDAPSPSCLIRMVPVQSTIVWELSSSQAGKPILRTGFSRFFAGAGWEKFCLSVSVDLRSAVLDERWGTVWEETMPTMGIVYKLVGLRKTHGQSHSGVAGETVPLTVNYNYS